MSVTEAGPRLGPDRAVKIEDLPVCQLRVAETLSHAAIASFETHYCEDFFYLALTLP